MYVNSKTDICNLASDLLSGATMTNVEVPATPEEELYSRWYELTRRKLLRDHPWNFAIKRAVLAASTTAPAFGYDKAYPLPADFVRLLTIGDGDNINDEIYPYQVEGGSILTTNLTTNDTTLQIRYIYDCEAVSAFDPMFIEVLAYEIALSLAYRVTNNNTNIERLNKMRNDAIMRAQAVDGQERPPIRIERSASRRARRQGHATNSNRVIF